MVYRFIQNNCEQFGLRWLLKKYNMSPNAYYNFLKDRKSISRTQEQNICEQIQEIYHQTDGILGHRNMKIFLQRKGIYLSKTTVHIYMNKKLQLKSVVRRKKPNYVKGHPHKIFANLIKQEFTADKPNTVWCTDFTYLFLTNGSKRYNCSIIDLYDRSIVASLNGKHITSELAIAAVKKALKSQPKIKESLIIHSDQGSQFTSKEFTAFCEDTAITQSMSKAGCPYDNAPMERYYNTLKNELIYHHHYHSDDELNESISNFAYTWYNHIRPHTFNGGLTPFEARNRN